MSTEVYEPLDAKESKALCQHEKAIERGLSTFYEVGSALMAIRDGRLYRVTHKQFETYCQDRWKMTRSYAHRLIEAAETEQVLPIGNKPQTESQARPLSKLPKERREEVWGRAVESAPVVNGQPKITAKHVEKVVAEELEPEWADDECDDEGDESEPTPTRLSRLIDLLVEAEELCVPGISELESLRQLLNKWHWKLTKMEKDRHDEVSHAC